LQVVRGVDRPAHQQHIEDRSMNETKVQASLNRIVAGINTEFDAMDDMDRGTLLANLTISLFRTCERDLTEESLELLLDEIERDEPAEALH